jgi:hypothetical protein
MKKISFILAVVIMMTLFASCGVSSKDVAPDEVTKETPTVETTVTEAPVVEATVTEAPKAAEQIENWSCESDVSENEDGTLTVDYIITDSNGKASHSFSENPDFDKGWYEMYTDAGAKLYEFSDFNFDGHLDIRTQQYGAMVNQYYNIRIWNTSIGEFELNQDYMGLPNPVVDAAKKQIFTTNFDRGLGNFGLYEVKDGVLTEIATIEVTLKDNGSFEYIETIGDGEGTVIKSVDDLDSMWAGYNVFIE